MYVKGIKRESYPIGDLAPIKGGKGFVCNKRASKPHPCPVSTLCTSYAIGYMLVIPSGFIKSTGSYSESVA